MRPTSAKIAMAEPVTPADARPPSPRQVLLGLFILFQLVFLIGSNLIGFARWAPPETTVKRREVITRLAPDFVDKSAPAWEWSEQVETNLRRWMQLTGQDQDWSLFAPGVAKATGFPAIVLIWDEPTTEGPSIPGTMFSLDAKNGLNLCAEWNHPAGQQPTLPLAGHVVLLGANSPWDAIVMQAVNQSRVAKLPRTEFILSENEPNDIHNFFRIGKARLRKYEGRLYINPQPNRLELGDSYDESAEDLTARLTRRMKSLVADSRDSIHDLALEYLRWRLEAWKRDHPDEPMPKQVILMHRLYRIRGPEEERGWEGPYLVPMLRWQPEAPRNERYYSVEPFDFADQRFYPVSR